MDGVTEQVLAKELVGRSLRPLLRPQRNHGSLGPSEHVQFFQGPGAKKSSNITHRQLFMESCESKPIFDFNYTFSIDLEPN